ncbi:hypothetical protein FI667_g6992, partial [Globisporangium splendens]
MHASSRQGEDDHAPCNASLHVAPDERVQHDDEHDHEHVEEVEVQQDDPVFLEPAVERSVTVLIRRDVVDHEADARDDGDREEQREPRLALRVALAADDPAVQVERHAAHPEAAPESRRVQHRRLEITQQPVVDDGAADDARQDRREVEEREHKHELGRELHLRASSSSLAVREPLQPAVVQDHVRDPDERQRAGRVDRDLEHVGLVVAQRERHEVVVLVAAGSIFGVMSRVMHRAWVEILRRGTQDGSCYIASTTDTITKQMRQLYTALQ